MSMSQETAEALAARVLAWIVAEDDLVHVFLGSTGLSTDDLREQAGSPEFLGSVLDFLLMDDAWIIRFCDASRLEYHLPQAARYALPGGDQVHWT